MWQALAVGAGTQLLSGALGSSASKKAANQQAQAAQYGREVLEGQKGHIQQEFSPYVQSGQQYLTRLDQLLAPGGMLSQPVDAEHEPGYQFGMQQGEQALQRQQAAMGRRLSPASLAALMRYNQDYAGTKYGEAFNRSLANRQQQYGFMSGMADRGASMTSQLGGLRLNYAGQQAGLAGQQGNAQAAGTMGSANAWGGALNNIGGMFQQQQMLDQYLNRPTGGGARVNQDAYGNMAGLVRRGP